MRQPIGSTDVSASGGTVRLVGRRGDRWEAVGDAGLSEGDAVALLEPDRYATADEPAGAVPSAAEGTYVNLELPHVRVAGEQAGVFSRDLVLDIWVDAEHVGTEDIWLKDEDELAASVEQGHFTPAQAAAVRSLADHAAEGFIRDGAWPLDDDWANWTPSASMDAPVRLPADPATRPRGL